MNNDTARDAARFERARVFITEQPWYPFVEVKPEDRLLATLAATFADAEVSAAVTHRDRQIADELEARSDVWMHSNLDGNQRSADLHEYIKQLREGHQNKVTGPS